MGCWCEQSMSVYAVMYFSHLISIHTNEILAQKFVENSVLSPKCYFEIKCFALFEEINNQ